ncbi:MAG: YkgJ family cysteine cluster protein [Desulfovibrionaceae bacterium]|nr:YkgJ family cysteine cluster protein [Desulfovibrionaceae bacterium]
MLPDVTPILTRYETLRAQADSVFDRVQKSFPQCVTCTKGCSDCCYALFDLSLVEALALNRAFAKAFDYGEQRSKILTRAAETDRKLTKLKRTLFRMEKEGASPEEVMAKAALERMACPLLEDGECLLYNDRPITCRLYGIPTVIGDRGHVCGFSKFDVGTQYPTVHLDTIQSRLEALSGEIAQAVQSRFTELDQVYVPVSMALLTTYDETYLGCGKAKDD